MNSILNNPQPINYILIISGIVLINIGYIVSFIKKKINKKSDVEQSLIRMRLLGEIAYGHVPDLLELTKTTLKAIQADLETSITKVVDTKKSNCNNNWHSNARSFWQLCVTVIMLCCCERGYKGHCFTGMINTNKEPLLNE